MQLLLPPPEVATEPSLTEGSLNTELQKCKSRQTMELSLTVSKAKLKAVNIRHQTGLTSASAWKSHDRCDNPPPPTPQIPACSRGWIPVLWSSMKTRCRQTGWASFNRLQIQTDSTQRSSKVHCHLFVTATRTKELRLGVLGEQIELTLVWLLYVW